MIPIVVDTDGGVDDAAALWWALTDPGLDVLAVTCAWGNVTAEAAAGNVLAILAAVGREDVPVAVGLGGPIGPAPALATPSHIHGPDGMGGTGRARPAGHLRTDAPAVLREVVGERPGEVTIVTLGPLSNLGRALLDDPSLAADAADLVVMGGAVRVPGNALPLGEANVAHDPVAAATVVSAGWRTPPLLVGLDVTMRATLSPTELDVLEARATPAARFLADPIAFYRPHGGASTAPDCPSHDLVALLAAADPALLTDAPVVPLAVDCGGGAGWGATVADLRRGTDPPAPGFAPWRVALDVDVLRFRAHARALLGGVHEMETAEALTHC